MPQTSSGIQMTGRSFGPVARWQWILFLLLQLFNLYQVLHHAMWRDELQIWSIARESNSLTDLVHNMRYDGFPPLWYVSVWLLSHISSAPVIMQLSHYSCAVASQFLIMKRSPFSSAMKLAIVAGYYFSFEYCVISRAYVLGVLFVYILCAYQEWFTKHRWAQGAMLGLLANTSVYGAILSLAFVAYDLWPILRRSQNIPGSSLGPFAAYGTIYAVCFSTAVLFMIPPENSDYFAGWDLQLDLTKYALFFSRNLIGLVPVPTPKPTFWSTLAAVEAGKEIGIPVSLIVLSAIWFSLRNSPRHIFLFFTGFIGIWLFTIIKFPGYVRHIGTAYILFIACLWLATASSGTGRTSASRLAAISIWSVLLANLFAWGIASYYHLHYDFSGSREMAQMIDTSGKNDYPIVGDVDFATSAVTAYLGRPVYYATNRKAQTFIRWDTERTDIERPADMLRFADELRTGKKGVLLLLNYPLLNGEARLIGRTRDTIVANETFYLYDYSR